MLGFFQAFSNLGLMLLSHSLSAEVGTVMGAGHSDPRAADLLTYIFENKTDNPNKPVGLGSAA